MDLQYLKKIASYIGTAVISVLVILYVLYHLFGKDDGNITTTAAEYVTMEQTLTANAALLREETILYAASDGSINYSYTDGQRVAAGSTVAAIYADGSIGEQLIDIDGKLSVLEKSSLSDSMMLSDTATVDSRIDSVYYQILDRLGAGDFGSALRRTDDLGILMNKRALITKESSGYEDKIALLREQRDAITAAAGDATEYITAPLAGYFYSQTDGYEGLYTSRNIADMQLSDYDMMCSSVPNVSVYSDNGKKAIGKLVTSYKWYLACAVPKSEYRSVDTAKTGFSVIFPSNNDERLEMQLYKVVNPSDDDRVLLIFSSGSMPDGFDYSRQQTVEIVTAEYSGYRVPVAAVTLKDGVRGVYVLDGQTAKFREIEPLFERDGWIICEEKKADDENQANRLSLYDFVITGGKDLYDGKQFS